MWLQMVFILPLILSANSISIPVEQNNDQTKESPIINSDTAEIKPTYYVTNEDNADSYLIPPNPHQLEEFVPDVVTPATYLLPPSQNNQDYYYNPTEPGEQTDWYPIAQNAPTSKLEAIPILYQNTNLREYVTDHNPRRSKAHEQTYTVPVPSLNLEPPSVDAPNDYLVPTTSEQLQIPEPSGNYNLPIATTPNKELPFAYRTNAEPILPLHLIPPQPYILKKYPKKIYPKKFKGEFKPVAIPIAQYADESASEIPRAKPVKLFKPLPSTEIDYFTPSDEKINYYYRKAANKQKLKGGELRQEYPSDVSVEDVYVRPTSEQESEQEASESLRQPGRNAYPAPLKQAPLKAPHHDVSTAPAPDERTEFRMHGMKGPHSYQFGYDTGKGKNRQFRYEERDNDGQVKGHYGYMDRHGKLRVVNYSAHPETGFHADAAVEKES